jgi:hypothetical protein
MALGAAPSTVRRRCSAKRACSPAVVALSVSRLIASMAFGVAATDPIAFMAARVVLLSVALLAAVVPTMRCRYRLRVGALRRLTFKKGLPRKRVAPLSLRDVLRDRSSHAGAFMLHVHQVNDVSASNALLFAKC